MPLYYFFVNIVRNIFQFPSYNCVYAALLHIRTHWPKNTTMLTFLHEENQTKFNIRFDCHRTKEKEMVFFNHGIAEALQ